MIVCIDSQVIIWGIKHQSTDGQEDMKERASDFFQWVDKNDHEIIIPTVIIAEVLAPEPPEIRGRYLEILNKNFIIVNFDSRAALKYAEILHGKFEDIKRLAADNGVVKQKMK
jgi:predicted nucleic acid-binding protein